MPSENPKAGKSKNAKEEPDIPSPIPDLLPRLCRTFSRETQSAIKLKLPLMPTLCNPRLSQSSLPELRSVSKNQNAGPKQNQNEPSPVCRPSSHWRETCHLKELFCVGWDPLPSWFSEGNFSGGVVRYIESCWHKRHRKVDASCRHARANLS